MISLNFNFHSNRLLAQGNSISTNALFFRVGQSTMKNIVAEVCEALVELLVHVYLPDLKQENWKLISDQFEQRWQLPHCIGALDGMHIKVMKPPNSGSLYFNYKKFFSIVLLGLCDAYKRFTWFNVGHFGKIFVFIIILL